jgi:hypothetical protein
MINHRPSSLSLAEISENLVRALFHPGRLLSSQCLLEGWGLRLRVIRRKEYVEGLAADLQLYTKIFEKGNQALVHFQVLLAEAPRIGVRL